MRIQTITHEGIQIEDRSAYLKKLEATIEMHRNGDPIKSYVALLNGKGLDEILKKIGEEAIELVIAAKNGRTKEIIHESADLLFHLLVLLHHQSLCLDDIVQELARRDGTSGLVEKERRRK